MLGFILFLFIGESLGIGQTARVFLSKLSYLSPEVALLHAVVGMIPPGEADLNPERNAHQTVVATKQGGDWRIAFFQNTPAQFHGRPDVAKALTDELRSAG